MKRMVWVIGGIAALGLAGWGGYRWFIKEKGPSPAQAASQTALDLGASPSVAQAASRAAQQTADRGGSPDQVGQAARQAAERAGADPGTAQSIGQAASEAARNRDAYFAAQDRYYELMHQVNELYGAAKEQAGLVEEGARIGSVYPGLVNLLIMRELGSPSDYEQLMNARGKDGVAETFKVFADVARYKESGATPRKHVEALFNTYPDLRGLFDELVQYAKQVPQNQRNWGIAGIVGAKKLIEKYDLGEGGYFPYGPLPSEVRSWESLKEKFIARRGQAAWDNLVGSTGVTQSEYLSNSCIRTVLEKALSDIASGTTAKREQYRTEVARCRGERAERPPPPPDGDGGVQPPSPPPEEPGYDFSTWTCDQLFNRYFTAGIPIEEQRALAAEIQQRC